MVMPITQIDAELLCRLLRGGCDYLGEHKEEVNALNVFPVPDGDTGINMYLTVSSAAQKLPASAAGMDVGKIAADFSMGTLMGARGNSGVILSQIFRGFANSLAKKQTADAMDLAQAFQKGVDLSYKSVMKPVEGTILTVFRKFAEAAEKAAMEGAGIPEMFAAAMEGGRIALERTPEQLPVLKEAGVVDAGGKGLLVFMDGVALAANEDYVPQHVVSEAPAQVKKQNLSAAAASDQDITYTFCTQMLIHGENLPVDTIREHLSQTPPGDSLLVVGDENVVKIHFHNNQPWEVMQYCAQFGELHDIIIDNMRDQHHDIQFEEEAPASAPQPVAVESVYAAPPVEARCGVVAVVTGEGMAAMFGEVGAHVIHGGQTMNPSAEDLLHAVEECPTEEVVILPNNSNIILTAEQVDSLTEKKVTVVRSKYVTQGLSAMMGFDPEQDAETNAESMTEAGSAVINGELTYAVRDTKFNGFDISEGDILALEQGEIVTCGKELAEVLKDLVSRMAAANEDAELISLFYGNDLSEEEAEELIAPLEEMFPDLAVELYPGGQPLYYFLIAVE